MESLTVAEILKFCNGHLILGDPKGRISSISLDSRNLKKNALFIAIKGERYDGHNFLKEALKNGAKGAVVNSNYESTKLLRAIAKQSDEVVARHEVPWQSQRSEGLPHSLCSLAMTSNFRILIQVTDTRKALGDIAQGYREKFRIPLIAITGSDGKTTTKELTVNILSSRFHLVKNSGNFNNEIGLPLTIFKLTKRTEVAIVELGMNRQGEIKRLSEIAEPTIGVITNIGESHQGFFKNRYGIARSKAELLAGLGKSTVILNRDSDYFSFLKRRAKGRVITFGIKKKSDFQAEDIVLSSSGIEFRVGNLRLKVPLLGYFNVYNVLVAIALAKEFKIPNQEIKKKLQNFRPLLHHFQLVVSKKFRIIDDTYNSNPFAFRKAIEQLKIMKTKGRKVIIAGEMKELGKFSKKAHYSIGEFIAKSKIDFLVTIGKTAKEIGRGAKEGGFRKENFLHCQSNEEVVKSKNLLLPDDLILIKGSRAVHLEEVVKEMKRQT